MTDTDRTADLAAAITQAETDAAGGQPWGFMCQSHMNLHGPKTLGCGIGQRLVLRALPAPIARRRRTSSPTRLADLPNEAIIRFTGILLIGGLLPALAGIGTLPIIWAIPAAALAVLALRWAYRVERQATSGEHVSTGRQAAAWVVLAGVFALALAAIVVALLAPQALR